MPESTFEPPRCPYCGADLLRVFETHYETYTFDPKTGTYKVDGEAEIKCPDCGANLYEVFPDGVCNYRTQA